MRPFTISSIEDELFLETYHDKVRTRPWPCGRFEYQLRFCGKITREQENILGEWLAYNCKENFVFYREDNTMIAGGCSDNKLAWDRSKGRRKAPTYLYTIRLDRKDIWLFRMVWVT